MYHFNFFLLKNNFKKYENFNIKIFPNSLYSSINLFLIKKFISFFVICILHYIYIHIFKFNCLKNILKINFIILIE